MDEAEGDESKNVNTTEAGDDMLINVTDVLNENLGNEESKPRKIQGYRQLNYRSQILDEICLEGLDGITLQALWLRLQERYIHTCIFKPNEIQNNGINLSLRSRTIQLVFRVSLFFQGYHS